MLSRAAGMRAAVRPSTCALPSIQRQLCASAAGARWLSARTSPDPRPLAAAASSRPASPSVIALSPVSRLLRLAAIAPRALPGSTRPFARKAKNQAIAASDPNHKTPSSSSHPLSETSESSTGLPGRGTPAEQKPTETTPSEPSSDNTSAKQPSEPHSDPAVTPEQPSESVDSKPPTKPQGNPLDHLPDLTQGIPSTLEYEQSQLRSALTAAYGGSGGDVPGAPGSRERELPASAYITSSERRRKALMRRIAMFAAAATVASLVYLGRGWDDEEEAEKHAGIPAGWGVREWWKRLQARLRETVTYYHEPAFEKLLPDPDPLYARPYTLVLGLEDVLVHSEWTRENGWRLAKRPGMDYFIRYLSQYFELILFTATPSGIADPSIRKVDPYHFMLPLFREATKWKDGEIVKV